MKGMWPPIPAPAGDNRPRQIAGYYRRLILDGHISVHEQLPTAQEIARLWDVSRSTATRSMNLLRLEGFTYSTARGVFVAGHENTAREG